MNNLSLETLLQLVPYLFDLIKSDITEKQVRWFWKRREQKILSDLLSAVDEYDYEKIDKHLFENYSISSVTNTIIPDDSINRIIDDFFKKNPECRCNKKKISNTIRKCLIKADEAIKKKLDIEHKILYEQTQQQTELISKRFNSLENLIKDQSKDYIK